MFNEFSKRNKAVRAALVLAEQRDWGDVTLPDIARHAGLDLADLRREFACKSGILRAFQSEVDAEVLSKSKPGPDQSVRDRVFDMVMTRFEVMAPYKPALKRIACHLRCRPGEASALACSTLGAQYWMLAGAGAKLDGAPGAVRVAGLTAIYGRVFRIWLEDTSPSHDKTMATLDRALGNGERMLERMDKTCSMLCGLLPRGWKRSSGPKDQPPASGPSPATSV
ncbi:MAG: TetR/AcrR family transcriptional regulator [Alphaproteobacteria bacterium]